MDTYDNYDESKSWKEKNENRKLGSKGYPVTTYFYRFTPINICPTPERAPVKKLVHWNASGIQIHDATAWLNLHKNGWEYCELPPKNFMEEVKQLMLH